MIRLALAAALLTLATAAQASTLLYVLTMERDGTPIPMTRFIHQTEADCINFGNKLNKAVTDALGVEEGKRRSFTCNEAATSNEVHVP